MLNRLYHYCKLNIHIYSIMDEFFIRLPFKSKNIFLVVLTIIIALSLMHIEVNDYLALFIIIDGAASLFGLYDRDKKFRTFRKGNIR